MNNGQRGSARGAVIQGSFVGSRFRLPSPSPVPLNQHSAQLQRIAQAKMAPPRAASPRAIQPGNATRQGPVVQRQGNSETFQLPAHLPHFGAGGGHPLPRAVQQKMESFFGTGFADVRIHVGPQASSIGALAFTQGSNVYFAQGQYNPHTPHGQKILGHELAHVVQQRAGRVRNPFGSGVAVVQDRTLEAEADRMGLRAATHEGDVRAGTVQSKRSNERTSTLPARFPVQRKGIVQRKNWKWSNANQAWEDGVANEALEAGAVQAGAAPNRRGHFDGEWVYVADLTQADLNQQALAAQQAQQAAQQAQQAAQQAQQVAEARYRRLTRFPLSSDAYVKKGGNRWERTTIEYNCVGNKHEEATKWNGFRWYAKGDNITERKQYIEWKGSQQNHPLWIGFTQNAWPCRDKCMELFIQDSTREGVNFLFNVIGDSGNYSQDHGRGQQTVAGVVVIRGGDVSYVLPPGIELPPDTYPK